MASLYPAIREILGEAMRADLYSVALYDRRRKRISFPFVAGRTPHSGAPRRRGRGQPDPRAWRAYGMDDAASPLGYVLRTKRPQLWTQDRIEKVIADGKVTFNGRLPTAALGAPMLADGESSVRWRSEATGSAPRTRRTSSSCSPSPANSSHRLTRAPRRRGNATAERRAGACQRNRHGAGEVSSTSTRSSSLSASGLPRSSP